MDYLDINKRTWDKNTQIHLESKFYDVDAFIQGKSSLNPIELAQIGDVKEKSLLHLQCHFGLDSLSWARLGAKVTGVDLSSQAIESANALAKELQVKASFINDDIYSFGEKNTQTYDIVYTSYGVLCWLPDLDLWANCIAKALKQGGEFHLVEFHPVNDLLSGYSYFPSTEPDIEEETTYTENCGDEKSTMVTWPHSLAEVLSALIKVGITIDELNEYPYSPYECFDNLQYVAGSGYCRKEQQQLVPLVYAIKGRKLAK